MNNVLKVEFITSPSNEVYAIIASKPRKFARQVPETCYSLEKAFCCCSSL